jgi:hypothetical protein
MSCPRRSYPPASGPAAWSRWRRRQSRYARVVVSTRSRISLTAPVLPAPELRNQHEIQKGDPGNRNLNPLPLRLGTQVAVALGPLCRSMPLHHATFPLVLHHRNRVAGLPPTVRHGLASPRDSPCDRDSARSCIARGSDVYACVRKGIPKDPCCTATGQCVTSIVRPSVAKHPYLVRRLRYTE